MYVHVCNSKSCIISLYHDYITCTMYSDYMYLLAYVVTNNTHVESHSLEFMGGSHAHSNYFIYMHEHNMCDDTQNLAKGTCSHTKSYHSQAWVRS